MKKWKKISLIVIFIYLTLIVIVNDQRYSFIETVSGANEDQIELKLGKTYFSDDDLFMIGVTKNFQNNEIQFINPDTEINSDFVQLQINDRAYSLSDNSTWDRKIEFTVRQFDKLYRNETTGLVIGFKNLKMWNETFEFVNGQAWGNIYLTLTSDGMQNVWVSYRNVRIEFFTETLNENLYLPRITNAEFQSQLYLFALVSLLVGFAGGSLGIYVEWRAKELYIPSKIRRIAWISSFFIIIILQIVLSLIDVNVTRNLFYFAVFFISIGIGVKSYSYKFDRWLIVYRKIDQDGNVEWEFKTIRVYYHDEIPYLLRTGFKETLRRIFDLHTEIKTDAKTEDQSTRTYAKILFAKNKHNERLTKGEKKLEKNYFIDVRRANRMKVEDLRLETLEVNIIEEELEDLDLELKHERARSRAIAFSNQAMTEEVELNQLGIKLHRMNGFSDAVIRREAIYRLKLDGKSVTDTTIKKEIEVINTELDEEVDKLEIGEYPESGIASKGSKLRKRRYRKDKKESKGNGQKK